VNSHKEEKTNEKTTGQRLQSTALGWSHHRQSSLEIRFSMKLQDAPSALQSLAPGDQADFESQNIFRSSAD